MITALFSLLLIFMASPASARSPFENEVFVALNALRAEPASFVKELKAMKSRFEGKRMRVEGTTFLVTQEGYPAVQEAAEALGKASAVGPLEWAIPLETAARDQIKEQSHSGEVGHVGKNGSTPDSRLEKYAGFRGKMGENIAYGNYGGANGRAVVIALAVDDGVASRGHRSGMLDPEFHQVGIACGPHPDYGQMCVMDFATRLVKKK